jgi:hypothetical protein
LELLTANLTAEGGTQQNYYEVKVKSKIATYGGCGAWNNYVGGSLSTSTSFLKPSSIKMLMILSYLQVNPTTVQCTDPDATELIVNKILAPSTSVTSVTCQAKTWKVVDCRNTGVPTVCVNCANPCLIDFCTPANPFFVGPCNTDGISCAFPSSDVRALQIKFTDNRDVYPTFVDSSLSVTKTTAVLNAELSGPGIESCGIFASSFTTVTAADILLQKNSVGSPVNAISPRLINFTFTNLVPSTSYNIYCYSESYEGASMTSDVVLATKLNVHTACCRTLFVKINTYFVYQSKQALNAVTLTSDYKVQEDVAVMMHATSDGGQTASYLEPFQINMRNLLTATASFTTSNTKSVGTVVVVVATPWTSAYDIVYVNGVNSFTVLAPAQTPLTPVPLKLEFSDDGSAVILTFSSPTDSGGRSMNLPVACSQYMRATGSTTTGSCQWRNNYELVMTLTPNSVLKAPDTVLLLGDTIKALCVTTTAVCKTWPYVDATILYVQNPPTAVVPRGKSFDIFHLIVVL